MQQETLPLLLIPSQDLDFNHESPGLNTHRIQQKMCLSAAERLVKSINRMTARQSAEKLFAPQSPTKPQIRSVQVWTAKLQGRQQSIHLLSKLSQNLMW